MFLRRQRWLVIAIALGIAFWFVGPAVPAGPWHMAFKGAPVLALAIFALDRATVVHRPIAPVMALCALGDILIEIDINTAALAFLTAHAFACWFYLYNRRRVMAIDVAVCVLAVVAIPSLTMMAWPDQTGVLAYSFGLAAMVACAWLSRFARDRVALGAVLFAVSDVMLFARNGVLDGVRVGSLDAGAVAGWLIWPIYFTGQVMIVQGVVARSQLMITASAASRANRRLVTATQSGNGA